MNRLFVAYKPSGISSNGYLKKLKREFGVKKAGYSGTLDPFAQGVLIVAFGQYTKLFRYLKKTPKTYKATLHLGAYSPTLDSEKIQKVEKIDEFKIEEIKKVLSDLIGTLKYSPPKFSAKNIDGKRAYELARAGKEFELKEIESKIYDIKLLSYSHPYLEFEISVSEGSYIRSIALIIAQKLHTVGALSELTRLKEGKFMYEDKKELNPIEYLDLKPNRYLGDKFDIILGRKLVKDNFALQKEGEYYLVLDDLLSIIEIKEDKVSYKINAIRLQGC